MERLVSDDRFDVPQTQAGEGILDPRNSFNQVLKPIRRASITLRNSTLALEVDKYNDAQNGRRSHVDTFSDLGFSLQNPGLQVDPVTSYNPMLAWAQARMGPFNPLV